MRRASTAANDPPFGDLPLILASPAVAREAASSRVRAWLASGDQDALAEFLAHRSLLGLLGSRLLDLAPGMVSARFRERVEADVTLTRRRSIAFEFGLREIVDLLETAGIRALPLKGIALAIAAHDDLSLRPMSDIDVLVHRREVPLALDVLTAQVYKRPIDPSWGHGLPLLHYTLSRRGQHGPVLELHWRVHWSEERFSEELVENAGMGAEGWRRPEPAQEFAQLLLFYARDGLFGMRLPADLVAWWERHGTLVPDGALEAISQRHPSLRRSLAAAAACLYEHFKLDDVTRLLGPRPLDRSASRAVALADPMGLSGVREFEQRVMSVDAFLAPGRHKIGFFRRYYFQPLGEVRNTYELHDSPMLVVVARRLVHTVGTVLKSSPAIGRHLWRTRMAASGSTRPPVGALRHTPFNVATRASLTYEVLATYVQVRLLMRRHALPDVLIHLRRGPRGEMRAVSTSEFRIAFIVQRVLRLVPTDTRCLMRSLVLVAMLDRRGISTKLVIGTAALEKFEAHAWVERDGEALLWSGGPSFGRLVEL